MTIFTDTMVQAIRKYRTMLRKYLPQAERVNHLHRLNLKNPQLYTNELMLYDLGYKMVEHLQKLDDTKNGYYSYSGISQFSAHLKKFLDKYKIEKGGIIHTSQLASRYLVKVTQILSLGTQSEDSTKELEQCNEMIALYASKDQIDLYQSTLQNMIRKHINDRNVLYRNVLQHFMQCLESAQAAAA